MKNPSHCEGRKAHGREEAAVRYITTMRVEITDIGENAITESGAPSQS
jgi:hypothetical protein